MATVNRVNGSTGGVRNVDAGAHTANATIVNTGINSPITAFKLSGIQTTGSGFLPADLATELGAPNGQGVPGAVESVLKIIQGNASVLAYQVDANGQLSVIAERSGWVSDTALKNTIVSNNVNGGFGNIGAYGNVYIGAQFAVSSTGGIKLA